MGLNKIYVGVRSNLLIIQPPTSLDNAYNILLNDEKKRQVQYNFQFNPESISFNVNTNAKVDPNPSVSHVPTFNTNPNPPLLSHYPQRVILTKIG